jgi:hypothetical protein
LGNGAELAGTQNLNDSQWHYLVGVSDGNTNALYLDGNLQATGVVAVVSTNAVPTNQMHAVIGGAPDYGAALGYFVTCTTTVRFWEGNVAQVAFFTNALSPANVATLYGAAGIPPTITSQPTSVSGGIGLAPTISVGVLGSPTLAYQWYKNSSPLSNGGNVSGATSANLTFNPVGSGDNASYYVVVTNNYGSVTSVTVSVNVYPAPTTAYASNLLTLNPAGYWPLTETTQPPAPYYATNLGTLGAPMNGVYETWWQTNGATPAFNFSNNMAHVPGVTADGDTAAVFGNNGQYVILPHNNPSSIITAPFSVEAWVFPTNTPSGTLGIISQSRNNINGATAWKGFWLGASGTTWVFALYNTNGQTSQEIDIPGIVANNWYHLVATFDGTVATLYTNGVVFSTGTGNGINPKTLTANGAGLRFVPDDNSAFLIGCLGNFNNGRFGAYIDEVAVYTNALASGDVTAHFTSVASGYTAAVQANFPTVYLRLDEPDGFTLQGAQATFPVATNYGNIGTAANGLYWPGTTPGAAGPTNGGFGSSYGVALNGLAGIEVGGGNLNNVAPQLNRVGAAPVSILAWFKGPVDAAGRFQNILGHSDNSWRLAVDTSGFNRFNPGAGTEITGTSRPAADGQWHMVAGVANGANDFLYIDGVQQATSTQSTTTTGDPRDVILGGDPQYTTPGTRFFLGSISQVAYFTNALSTAQVLQIYQGAGFAPTVSTQPTNIIANAGGSAADSVTAGGTPTLSYQWYKGTIGSATPLSNGTQGNGTVIGGATTSAISFSSLALSGSDSGTYFVVAGNAYGSVTSSVVTMTVNTAPKVTQQPPSFSVFTNATCTFTIAASGASPLSYQWLSNAVPIGNATNASFTLSNVLVSYSANYSCKVTNTLGTDISSNGVLAVTDPNQSYQGYVRAVLADLPTAYWRLDESDGLVAYDWVGAHNGQYTNTALNQPGVNALDPDTAASFGTLASSNSYAGNIPGISYAATNGNAAFSVEAWVKGGAAQVGGAGIVSKGYSGAEQFALDYNGVSGVWRFFVRDALSGIPSHVANATTGPDGSWHHLVGVCDEPNSNAFIYVDGLRVGSAAITTNSGTASAAFPVVIGSRQSISNANFDFQFNGVIDEVAIYGYALSASQVQAHYNTSQRAPVITTQPAGSQIRFVGSPTPLTFNVAAGGTPVLSYQWYKGTPGNAAALSDGGRISGSSSTQLVLAAPIAFSDGTNYFAIVNNSYGRATSIVASVVIRGAPGQAYPQAVLADSPIAYWRLGETNSPSNGATAFDYVGGHNGTYTNTVLGAAGYRAYDPDTAATFGSGFTTDSHVQNIQGIDFAAPTNSNSSFSVECWVLGSSTAVTTDAGLVTRGAGNSGEQFNLDLGAPSHGFRFFVRRADTNTMLVNGTLGPSSTTWHHVVGVANEAQGRVFLYVDGVLNNSAGGPTNAGIMTNWSGDAVSIGARRSTSASATYNNQFFGTMDEVAIYNYALSSTQVLNHYFAAGVAPTVLLPPATTNVTISEGASVTLTASATGTPPLHYQWWQDFCACPLPGKTGTTLTLNNVSSADNLDGYYVVVTNAFGTVTSPEYILNVVAGPPQIVDDLALLTVVYAGRSVNLAISVAGTPPFTYQWTHAGTNLSDNAFFTGTHSNVLTVAQARLSDAGTYQCNINNNQGGTSSSPGTLEVETLADFNGTGLGWVFNTFLTTAAGWQSPDVLTLTDGAGGEASSAWYQYPLYIGSFAAFYTYQDVTGFGGADGVAFVIQNDSRGIAAIGGTGGGLGYGPDNGGTAIQPSVGLEFNIYNGHTVGYAFRTNGLTGEPYATTGSISLSSGDPIDVLLYCVNGVIQMTLTDETTLSTYSASFTVGDLSLLVGGSTAYVGVTGASGGVASRQTISNFAFYPIPTLSSQLTSTNTVLLYWPASIGGYTLQSKATVDATSTWADVAGTVTVAGGLNQVVVSPTSAQFYRLKATLP